MRFRAGVKPFINIMGPLTDEAAVEGLAGRYVNIRTPTERYLNLLTGFLDEKRCSSEAKLYFNISR